MEIRAMEKEKEALCPCGSERQYKDCCAGQGRTFGLLEYEAKKILFDVDETERDIDALIRFCHDMVSRIQKNPGRTDAKSALRALKTIYELADKALRPFSRGSSCRAGCHACCYHIVETTAVEAEIIRRYARVELDSKARLSVLTKIENGERYYPGPISFEENYSDHVTQKYLDSHIPCPFLFEQGLCMIYQVRPMNCRKHMVFSDPDLCSTEHDVASYEAEYFAELDNTFCSLSADVYSDLTCIKHLPTWFTDEFKL
jgi:Fe-S-cluster containining protein